MYSLIFLLYAASGGELDPKRLKIWIPNPHQGDISKSLLAKILQQANISREEWEKLR
ncbi:MULTISPECIES: hypothetical protein [unclassified Microcystis]|uniref:hypothetical protein n=1 Tax=unclassified Microcystis TaxID=2643300 RepID=UPI0022C40ED8|nr:MULTISPECIES: hypothetical protein [unclassified Microcystis]MCA2694507.1 hypothetical protein [Microcystis sp. M034S2]MCA2750755.1 hypothetical protein [Microcystis sp. M144S2]MCZ8201876.1 hypothetical protein [Microcystis sp. LE19-55.1A]MCZ8308583.1 hypothetical protein [Microcystis sp. LE19-98.1E]